jgi:D-aminopeptidase
VTVISQPSRCSTPPCSDIAPIHCRHASFSLNGAGEMTGSQWVDESGMLFGPVMITNTHSVGVVRDATVKWQKQFHPGSWFGLPVVGETYDGFLSDIDGHHVHEEHAWAAINGAASGPVEEGCVGGGTGMLTARFKGGIGTASRSVRVGSSDTFTVGKHHNTAYWSCGYATHIQILSSMC